MKCPECKIELDMVNVAWPLWKCSKCLREYDADDVDRNEECAKDDIGNDCACTVCREDYFNAALEGSEDR